METTLTYLHAHLELKESALAKLKLYERAKAERFRPNDRLLEFLNALHQTMPSVNGTFLTELAGNALRTVAIRRGIRHSSPVGINCQTPWPQSGDLFDRCPDQDTGSPRGPSPGITAVALDAGERPMRGCVIARSRFIYTLKEVASMIGNLELIEEVIANSDNIAEGELVYVRDGTEDGTKGQTENGNDDLQSLLAGIRTWDGGIRQFLVDEQCDPEMIDSVMVDEVKRVP